MAKLEVKRAITATDVSGHSWTYDHDPLGQIVSAAHPHPDGDTYLEIGYDHVEKVARFSSVSDLTYSYIEDATTVSEPCGNKHFSNVRILASPLGTITSMVSNGK